MLKYKTFDDFVVLFISPLVMTNIGCGTHDSAVSMVLVVLQRMVSVYIAL